MYTIKEIRESTGLSQSKFCDALNIPLHTLQKWERGARSCPEYVVELIAYRVQHDPMFRNDERLRAEAEVQRLKEERWKCVQDSRYVPGGTEVKPENFRKRKEAEQ